MRNFHVLGARKVRDQTAARRRIGLAGLAADFNDTQARGTNFETSVSSLAKVMPTGTFPDTKEPRRLSEWAGFLGTRTLGVASK